MRAKIKIQFNIPGKKYILLMGGIAMKMNVPKIINLIVVTLLVLSIVAGIAALLIKNKQDERAADIKWAEAADDAEYADVKALWKDYIEDKYDVVIDKVAFNIDIRSYLGPDFSVEVWYRTTDGEWSNKTYHDLFVPSEIYEKLVEIISS